MTPCDSRILRPSQIGDELIEVDREYELIKDRFPDIEPERLRKTIYAALWLPLTTDGLVSRLILRHSYYMRFWSPIDSFVVYDPTKSVRCWRPVPDLNMHVLVQSAANGLLKELDVLRALVEAGDLSELPEDHEAKARQLITTATREHVIVHRTLVQFRSLIAEHNSIAERPTLDEQQLELVKKLIKVKQVVKRGPRKTKAL